MPARPMLGDLELQQVQHIDVEEDQALVQHAVPGLEGDFFQRLGRRATRVALSGVCTGPEVRERLNTLRQKFHAAEPVPFVADITTATQVDQVLIQSMGMQEVAGKPERFEYTLILCEFILSPDVAEDADNLSVNETAATEAEARQEEIFDQIALTQGTLEVTVEPSELGANLGQVEVQLQGRTDDGQDYQAVLDKSINAVFRKTDIPAGQYTVTLSST